ncbi:MAG: flagellar hook assembly protein FlgD [Rhodoferax sp.]|nr:flagellar hook assembly protein FlgD [Rhodoferax sp.]
MALNAISSPTATSAASPSIASTNAESEQRFLKLLTTQLNNQDPLNPLDNAQLTSQLAQMSTVSGIEKLNSTVESLLAQTGSGQVLQAAGLIDRSVLAPGSNLALQSGSATPCAVDLPVAATSVKVNISNAAGQLVRSLDLGALPPGVQTLSWDGANDKGQALASGSYQFSVTASGGGANVAAVPLTYGNVSSVAQGPNGVALNLADRRVIGFSDVRSILSAPVASL